MPIDEDCWRDRLAALAEAEDIAIGLTETALMLAALDRPQAPFGDYLAWRDEVADELTAAGTVEDRAGLLADTLAGRRGLRGCDRDDDDVRNANMMWVIDNCRGVGDALGLLWLDAARAAGWDAAALSFPGRVLVRLGDGSGRSVIVDPFRCGQRMEPHDLRALVKTMAGPDCELRPGHSAVLGNRDLLVRLQNDIKLRLLRCGRMDKALTIVETILLFAPNHAILWREAGLMHMRLGRPKPAIAALEQFIARDASTAARHRAAQLIQDIRLRM